MSKYFYYTDFSLTNPVNDYQAARDYLLADDMTKYLKHSIDYDKSKCGNFGLNSDMIISVEWELHTEYSGIITLTTTEKLSSGALDYISRWVSGQCSDGLGEGFEQQDFAQVYSDEDEDDYDYSEVIDMASFDWRTNKYKFEFIRAAEGKVKRSFKGLKENKGRVVRSTLLESILGASGESEIRAIITKRTQKITEGNWRGVPSIDVVSHGSQADPDLVWKAADGTVYTFNYWDIEDALWHEFLDEMEYHDSDSSNPKVEKEFNEYLKHRAVDYLQDVIAGGYFKNSKNNSWHESKDLTEKIQTQAKRFNQYCKFSADITEVTPKVENSEEFCELIEKIITDFVGDSELDDIDITYNSEKNLYHIWCAFDYEAYFYDYSAATYWDPEEYVAEDCSEEIMKDIIYDGCKKAGYEIRIKENLRECDFPRYEGDGYEGDFWESKKLKESIEYTLENPLKVECPRGAYYLWQSDGEIWGSVEKPNKFIVNARGIKNWTKSGFENLEEVIEYVKKYF